MKQCHLRSFPSHLLALSEFPEIRISENLEIRIPGNPEDRDSGNPEFRKSGNPDVRKFGVFCFLPLGAAHFAQGFFQDTSQAVNA